MGASVELFHRSSTGAGTAPTCPQLCSQTRQDAPVHLLLPKMCQSWCQGAAPGLAEVKLKSFLLPYLKELHEITVAALAQFCTD